MSQVVISAFEDLATGDLQAEGEAVTVFDAPAQAQAHFSKRCQTLAAAMREARASNPDAHFITWVLLLELPLPVDSVEQALEDLELVIEEADDPDEPFAGLVLDYQGHRHGPDCEEELPAIEALQTLEAWLS